ncbi:MAG: hypothetical protein DRJ69_00830 [Thermoprotei archaeon]|nr:MAG: hypothetical protein DRJ59_03545 [Thermoprotei archaeon]RLF12609.1 MAG: hypothetical protein DRJ69_00830 [Thermoprotei archaeon]
MELYEQIVSIVGSKYVSDRAPELFLYSWDFMTTEPPGKPQLVVMPKDVEEVQAIVRLANRAGVPVIPYVQGTSVAGLTNPNEGGIVMDLKRMNKVLEVNEEDMYAVVEAGITQAQLKRHLDKNHPSLRFAYTWGPPGAGVLPALLNQGFLDLSLRYGSAESMINGLEVVLPTGEVVRIGSCSVSPYWFTRNPLPDLMGLFIGWQGTTGIVTKAGIKLFTKFPYQEIYCVDSMDVESGFKAQILIAKADIADDICSENWAWSKMSSGYKLPFEREEGEPELYTTVVISANTEKELEAKEEILKDICNRVGVRVYKFKEILPTLPKGHQYADAYVNFPIQISNDWDGARGGSLQWVGVYIPNSLLAEAYRRVEKIYQQHGFLMFAYNRMMDHGHSGIIRFSTCAWKKHDERGRKAVRRLMMKVAETLLELGGVIYKPPPWAARMNLKRADPYTVELMRRVKKLLDPNRVMNPGKWDL